MAGLPQHSVKIGAFEYSFALLPVETGHPLRWELIAFLGEPLVAAIAGMVAKAEAGAAVSFGDADVETLLAGLSRLFTRLDPKFVWKLQQTFIAATLYRAAGGEWTELSKAATIHFAGRYHDLDQLTFAHLRANYLGFLDDSAVFQALFRAGRQALSAAKSRSTSPSTGTSGASSVANTSM